jgi:hypothetical protein
MIEHIKSFREMQVQLLQKYNDIAGSASLNDDAEPTPLHQP